MNSLETHGRACLISVLGILLFVTILKAEVSEFDAQELARNSHCAQTLVTNPQFLRVSRDYGLEDDFAELLIASGTAVSKANYFFRVTTGGYFILPGQDVVHIDQTGRQFRLIGVGREDGKLYPLYGCSEAERAFETLVENARLRLRSTADASKFALLNYSLEADPEKERLITNFLQFSHLVQERFFAWLPPGIATKKYRRWFDRNRDSFPRLGAAATESSSGFRASVAFAFGPDRNRINLQKIALEIDRSGRILDTKTITLASIER